MHYKAILITKELPKDTEINKIMAPYNWDNLKYDENDEIIGERPVFTWDWFCIGGRYCGSLKLKIDLDDEYYNWRFYAKELRNGRLFLSSIFSDLEESIKPAFRYSEEKYQGYMGSRDDFLYVDGARAKDILNYDDQVSYILIDINGKAIARESWIGSEWIDNKHYDEDFKAIMEKSKDYFITVLDIHD